MDRTAALALVVANLAIAAYIVCSGWGYYQAIVVFWLEAVIIGVFSTLKLYVVAMLGHPFGRFGGFTSKFDAFVFVTVAVGFFLIKLGGFVIGVGLAVLLVPGWLVPEGDPDMMVVLEALEGAAPGIGACLAFLMVSHGISFVMNFIRHREYESMGVLSLLVAPYVRMLYLLVTLALAVAVAVLQPLITKTTAFALVLVTVKLGADLLNHLLVHRRLARKRLAAADPIGAAAQAA